MKTRRLGRTGLKVSEICLGTMTFAHQCDEKTSFQIMDKASERGVSFFDTADIYPVPPTPETAGGTETIVGKWLKGKRDRFVLATKCRMRVGTGPNDEGLSRRHILKACDDSLRRLQTDYIDLYQPHQPHPDTPVDETLRVHPGSGIIAYNPLAGRFLTGKYKAVDQPTPGTRFALGGKTGALYRERYWEQAQLDAAQRLTQLLQSRGKALLPAAVTWVLTQPGITSAIVGASKPEQLDQSFAAVDMTMDDAGREACDRVWYELPRRPAPR